MANPFFGAKPRHDLSIIALIAFTVSFFGSRAFTTVYPDVVVVQGAIHFHHFWYGLAMIGAAGWLGIAWRSDRLDRVYAVVYGLGAGFIGDEVGLLLTFGNYYSNLTYEFFAAAVSFSIAVMLAVRYRQQLEKDVLRLGRGERLTHFGIFVLGFSTIFFAAGVIGYGAATAGLGALILIAGILHDRRRKEANSPNR